MHEALLSWIISLKQILSSASKFVGIIIILIDIKILSLLFNNV